MRRDDLSSLRGYLAASIKADHATIQTATLSVPLEDLISRSVLGRAGEELRGQSVVLMVNEPALLVHLLVELDGSARRLVLCPAGLGADHLDMVISDAEADVIIVDSPQALADAGRLRRIVLDPKASTAPLGEGGRESGPVRESEWILLTSGTSGSPKLVVHNLASLVGAIKTTPPPEPVTWCTFYDIRRYGGLQILLRALVAGVSLVLAGACEETPAFMARAATAGVTHMTGTPSHWRRAFISGAASTIDPHYVRLSGEIADQAILDRLKAQYPQAKVAHAFASTEGGVAFEVEDGLAGFPTNLVGDDSGAVQLRVVEGSLCIRSSRRACGYLGPSAGQPIADSDGFVDTGDMVERRDDRYYFVGRRGGVINVGGQKVHPEEIEAVIGRHPAVEMVVVRARKNAFMGTVAAADVVLTEASFDSNTVRDEILDICRRNLAGYKIPATIRFVPALAFGAAGKLTRSDG